MASLPIYPDGMEGKERVKSVIDLSSYSSPFLDKKEEDLLYSPSLVESSDRIARDRSTGLASSSSSSPSSGSSSSGNTSFLPTGSSSVVARQLIQEERSVCILARLYSIVYLV